MAAPKKPQDHKPKATEKADPVFEFEADGKTYTLPTADKFGGKVPGAVTADAIMYPDDNAAQLRLALHLLSAVEGYDDTVAMVRSLPSERMFGIVGEWMDFGDGEVPVPQS